MAHIINTAFNAIGDTLMVPFLGLHPWFGLGAFSLFITLVALVTFRFFSNPEALARARGRAFARILEFRLYKDDILGVFGTLGRVLLETGRYMGHYIVPIAIMIVPVLLLLVQMACWFERRPLEPGESVLVTATLMPDVRILSTSVQLEPPQGMEQAGESLRIPSERQLVWKLKAVGPVETPLRLGMAGHMTEKTIRIGGGLAKLSSARVSQGFIRQLENPVERPLPREAHFESIELAYPARTLTLGPWRIHWLAACFGLTILLGLALKGVFRVEF